MHVLVVGGTGRTGQRIVRATVGAGHTVVALGRSAGAQPWPEGVTPCAADVLDDGVLSDALSGVDAVVTALSIPRTSRSPFAPLAGPADLHSRTTALLLEAMATRGVQRLVKVSAQGVGDSAPRAGWGFRALVAASNLRPAFEDHAIADGMVQASPLSWTIVRPPMLVDAGPTDRGLHGAAQRTTWTWTRVHTGDVAAWIVQHLSDPDTYGRTLTLGPA